MLLSAGPATQGVLGFPVGGRPSRDRWGKPTCLLLLHLERSGLSASRQFMRSWTTTRRDRYTIVELCLQSVMFSTRIVHDVSDTNISGLVANNVLTSSLDVKDHHSLLDERASERYPLTQE